MNAPLTEDGTSQNKQFPIIICSFIDSQHNAKKMDVLVNNALIIEVYDEYLKSQQGFTTIRLMLTVFIGYQNTLIFPYLFSHLEK